MLYLLLYDFSTFILGLGCKRIPVPISITMFRLNLLFVCSLLLLADSVFAQVDSAYSNANLDLISISGTVVDENGTAIKDATVYLSEWPTTRISEIYGSGPKLRVPKMKFSFAETKTDVSGRFRFNGVQAPAVDLRNYQSQSRWSVIASVPDRPLAWHKLPQAQVVEKIQLTVEPGTSVEGVVRDEAGLPVVNAEVYVNLISEPGSRRFEFVNSTQQFRFGNSELAPRAITGSKGRFEIPNLPKNKRVDLVVLHDEFAEGVALAATGDHVQPDVKETKYQYGKYVTEISPVQSGAVQINLPKGNQLNVQIVDGDNKPVANQRLTAYFIPSGSNFRAKSDAEGRFQTPRFSDPYVRLYVSDPNNEDYVQCDKLIQFESDENEKSIQFRLSPAKAIQGRVCSEDSVPIAGVTVSFVPENSVTPGFERYQISAVTDDSGEFKIRVSQDKGFLIATGPVFGYELADPSHVNMYKRGNRNDLPPATIHIDLSQQNAIDIDERSIEIVAQRSRRIAGRVINESGSAVPEAKIEVIYGFSERNYPFRNLENEEIKKLFAVESDDNGAFSVEGIPHSPGIIFSVTSSDKQSVALMHVDKLENLQDALVILEPAVSLHGRVTLDDQPASGVKISVNLIGNYQANANGDFVREKCFWGEVETNMAGEYQFTGVPAKPEYFIQTTFEGQNESRNPKYDGSIKTIEIPPFEFVSRNSKVSGIVRSPSGEPVSGVRVSARKRLYSSSYSSQVTGDDGTFTLTELPDNSQLTIVVHSERSEHLGPRRFNASVEVTSADTDVTIIFDPRLSKILPKR
jgi:protocatechuate 3,4-dioxygenase beta subunit